MYASIDGWTPANATSAGDNILDRWILSRLQTLKASINVEMERYRLYNVVPKLFSFINDLTNTYIRLNRARFWGEGMTPDKAAAYTTLHKAVRELSVAMAPFAPFLAEHIYQALAQHAGEGESLPVSVHLCPYPEADEAQANVLLEEAVSRMQQVIDLGRRKREDVKINLRTPLRRLTIVHRDAELLAEIGMLENYVKAELNVKDVQYDTDESEYIALVAKPNFPVLGKRLGKRMRTFQASIAALDATAIESFQETGSIVIEGETFDATEIQVLREAKAGTNAISNRYVSIDLDIDLDDDLVGEGWAREFVNRIQRERKRRGFEVSDRIRVRYDGDPALETAIETHRDYIARETLATDFGPGAVGDSPVEAMIDAKPLGFALEVV